MAVFRIEKTRDYTVMANHHLRNTKLSLKAKGLLGGLGLYHQRACEDMQGRCGQHLLNGE